MAIHGTLLEKLGDRDFVRNFQKPNTELIIDVHPEL